jgi:hypothetical protein
MRIAASLGRENDKISEGRGASNATLQFLGIVPARCMSGKDEFLPLLQASLTDDKGLKIQKPDHIIRGPFRMMWQARGACTPIAKMANDVFTTRLEDWQN